MAGNAVTNDFMLGTATVMIGPQADLFKLNVANHSIGLVKNFRISSQPNYVELTQGVKNTIVDSQMNQNAIRATMEVYEFTAKNLSYGLGLDGSTTVAFTKTWQVASNAVGNDTLATLALSAGFGTGGLAGDSVMLEANTDDNVLLRKITDIATDKIMLDYPLPTGFTLPASGGVVRKVNVVDGGAKSNQPYLSAHVAGVLGNGTRVSILIPKLRLVKGFDMGFTTNDYGNLPFEFTPYDLVATDAFYSYFGGSTFKIARA